MRVRKIYLFWTICIALGVLLGLFISNTAQAGTFQSSDPLLNSIWQTGAQTAADMLAPGGQTVDAEGRSCPLPVGMTVIMDGVVRDRCPYIGDESVIGRTFDASTPRFSIQRDMLKMFANEQYADGAIPSSPLNNGMILFDYCGYWATVLHNYVLYSGDLATGQEMLPHLIRLLDGWYVSKTRADGLLVNDIGHYDYGFMRRTGTVVSYFNAQYVYVLRQSAELAGWLGRPDLQARWQARARSVTAAFNTAFWDPVAGAYTDTTLDRGTHPEDGNSFAILSGLATPLQATKALAYLSGHESYSYGNSIIDSTAWDDPAWGYQSNMRVYPFMGFYDVLARYEAGQGASALNLIRREWGYMLNNGPQPAADWELIGPYGGGPTDWWPSWDAGWSSGATPALTQYVLGVTPTSPGFTTFTVVPHPDGLEWASGTVTTPRGDIAVSWKIKRGKVLLAVTAPAGERREGN